MDKAQNIFLKDLNLMPSLKKLLKMHRAGTPAWNVYVCTCALMKGLNSSFTWKYEGNF